MTADPDLGRAMRNVRIGDQIRFRGYLADYTIHHPNGQTIGPRVTSTVRTDSGPGACEIVYVSDLSLIPGQGHRWALVLKIALAVFVLSLAAWAFLPVRFAD